MTHTVKESLRWLTIMTYWQDSEKIDGAYFSLPKESGYHSAYKIKQNWKVIWRKQK